MSAPINRLRSIQMLSAGHPKIAPPLPTPIPYPVNKPVALTRLRATAKIASMSTPKGFDGLTSTTSRNTSGELNRLVSSGNLLNGSSAQENAVSVMASGGGRSRSSCEADGGRSRSSCEPDEMDDEMNDETLTKVTPF